MNPLYFYVLFAGGPVPDVTMSIEYITSSLYDTPKSVQSAPELADDQMAP
jgi:hypothetical protein